uniref:Cysteine proteinase inhibitor 1 n=1 Tax=Elaeis guineensis var. tenera TaxID=51953 RepID=A0A8N4F733_ELAGV|nr:cysteine proteinase inhibitor 1 [Elaeis guineensis]
MLTVNDAFRVSSCPHKFSSIHGALRVGNTKPKRSSPGFTAIKASISPPIHRNKIPHPPILILHHFLFSSQPWTKKKISSIIFAMRSLPLLLLPLLLTAIHSPPRALAVLPGGWQPIKDIKDPHVQEIAEFAVSEHNRLANTSLALSKVVKGETQVVEGINYRLVLEAKDGETKADYVAVVWEKVWENFRKLTSFTAVHH